MKTSELNDMTVAELMKKEEDMRKELFNLRFQKSTGEIENHMRIRSVRKGIARVLTVMSVKKKAGKV